MSNEYFNKLASTGSKRVGNLLGTMLKKQYPHLHGQGSKFSVSFDELLGWNLWPNFIRIYGKFTINNNICIVIFLQRVILRVCNAQVNALSGVMYITVA